MMLVVYLARTMNNQQSTIAQALSRLTHDAHPPPLRVRVRDGSPPSRLYCQGIDSWCAVQVRSARVAVWVGGVFAGVGDYDCSAFDGVSVASTTTGRIVMAEIWWCCG